MGLTTSMFVAMYGWRCLEAILTGRCHRYQAGSRCGTAFQWQLFIDQAGYLQAKLQQSSRLHSPHIEASYFEHHLEAALRRKATTVGALSTPCGGLI